MPAQTQVLRGGVEGNFVTVEPVRTHTGVGHAHDQSHVPPAGIGDEDLHAHFAVGKGWKIAHQFVAGGAGEMQFIATYRPSTAIGGETLRGGCWGRLLKTLAKEHLAVETAIDLAVHIFKACTGQVGRQPMQPTVGLHFDHRFLRQRWARQTHHQRRGQSRTANCLPCGVRPSGPLRGGGR